MQKARDGASHADSRVGGVMTEADLAAYAPQWETPLHTTYRGYDVYRNASTTARFGQPSASSIPRQGQVGFRASW